MIDGESWRLHHTVRGAHGVVPRQSGSAWFREERGGTADHERSGARFCPVRGWRARPRALALRLVAPRLPPPPLSPYVQPSPPVGHTLLLVEDNEDNRIIYSTVLRHLGYEVIEALDGVEAVALARSRLPDLILMDISIPEMDGWEATRVLRADERTRRIPIIALTAHALAD